METTIFRLEVALAFIALLNVLLGARVISDWLKDRREKKQRSQDKLHETESKLIDADIAALSQFSDRLHYLEGAVSELNKEIRIEMQKSAKLEAENKSLQKENERLSKNIHDMRADIQNRDLKILKLETQIAELTKVIEKLSPMTMKTNET